MNRYAFQLISLRRIWINSIRPWKRSPIHFISLIVLLVGHLATYTHAADPTQPAQVQAFHRSGQTFITWNELTTVQGEQYRIYRHTVPIVKENIDSATLLGTLSEGSSAFHTERLRDPDYPPESNGGYASLRNYVIEPRGDQLSDTTGLLVWTVQENQASYYAVTSVVEGTENRIDFGTGNTFGPLSETVTDPSPILVWQSESGRGRVYTQFMDFSRWNPTFETRDGLTYAYNYFVGYPSPDLAEGTLPSTYALLLHIEGYGSRYEAGDGSHYFCCLELWCDDPRQSWYYGYSATHDYRQSDDVPVTTGPIVNFTEERIQRAIFDLLRDPLYSNIDPQRIFAYGHSMGASGSLALAIRYPDLFTAVYCSEPMTNYREASAGSEVDWVATDLTPKWGSIAVNLPIENRGVYANHLARFNGTGVWDWQNHQSHLIQYPGEETAFIALAHGTRDRVIAWDSQGRLAYDPLYQSLRAFSGEIIDADHTWIGFSGLCPSLDYHSEPGSSGPFYGFAMIRDESLPAFTHASGSLPVPPTTTGGYNMNLEWSTSWNPWAGAPVDQANRWEMAIRSLTEAQTVDITPRRLQRFVVTSGAQYDWQNQRLDDNSLLAKGRVQADANGLITISSVTILPEGNRLILSPSTGEPIPTLTPTHTPTFTIIPAITSTPTPFQSTTPTFSPTQEPSENPTQTMSPTPIGSVHIPLEIRFPDEATGMIPVTVGVPLPPGTWSIDQFTVANSQGAIPSQIREAVRSGPLGSISWLLVDFQAERGMIYHLETGTSPAPANSVTITQAEDESVWVDTGAGRYHVIANSTILGEVEKSDGTKILNGAQWNSALHDAEIEIVEAGPLRALICLRSENAVQGLDLVARIHFYAGLPYIRLRLTLINHSSAIWGWENPTATNGECPVEDSQPVIQGLDCPATLVFDDITWSLNLTLAQIGIQDEILYQDSSGTDHWNFYVGQGPRMQSGVTRRGYVRIQDGQETETGNIANGSMIAGGVRLEVPWFRELFPKALRAQDGRLEFGIFPAEYSLDHRLRPGEQKTHDVWLSLDPSFSPPWQTLAFPSFSWMRSTHGLGWIGPRRSGTYYSEYEDYLDAQFDPSRENRDGYARSVMDAQQTWDLMGWMDFGDLPTDFENGRSPYNLKYDVGLGFIHQAIRINSEDWWHWARISNPHFADVDLFHSRVRGYEGTRQWFEGGAWGHSLHDESGLTNPHRNCNNPNTDLYYGAVGMIAWVLLTGDEMVREAALEMSENTLWRIRNTNDDGSALAAWGGGNGEGYGAGGLRAVANVQRILVWGWRMTGDRAYLDAAGRASHWYMLERENLEEASWPTTLFTRSQGEYIQAARDAGIDLDPDAIPAMIQAMQSMANHMTREGDRAWFSGVTGDEINAWMLLAADAFALGYAATGDRHWLDDYAIPSFNTGARDPFYEGDLSHYHSSKELVNTVAAGTIFLHFVAENDVIPTPEPTPTEGVETPTPTPSQTSIQIWNIH